MRPCVRLLLLSLTTTVGGGDSTQLPGAMARFIRLNQGATARGELVVWMPLTVVLPSLGYNSRYTSHTRSQRLAGRDLRGKVDRVLPDRVTYDPSNWEYRAGHRSGPLLSRLRVNDDDCRQKSVRQLTQRPDTFDPFSQLVLTALRKSDSHRSPLTTASWPSAPPASAVRFLRHQRAALLGSQLNQPTSRTSSTCRSCSLTSSC